MIYLTEGNFKNYDTFPRYKKRINELNHFTRKNKNLNQKISYFRDMLSTIVVNDNLCMHVTNPML